METTIDTATDEASVGPPGDIWVGPLRRQHTEDFRDFLQTLSPASRRLRFFQAMPRVPASTVRWLCDVDQERHLALVARTGGSDGPVIGEVRAVRDRLDPTSAEVAVAVRDDWHRRGVGRHLLRCVGELAASHGVERLTCEVLPDNSSSIALFSSLGTEFRFDGGVLVGQLDARALVPCGASA